MAQRRQKASPKPRSRSPQQTVESLRRSLTREREQRREALEQQAATVEVLGAMSKSPGDAQPVFEAIVDNAHGLCEAAYTVLYRYDGKLIHLVAAKEVDAKVMQAVRGRYPQPPDRNRMVGRTVLEKAVLHTADIYKDSRFPAAGRAISRRAVVCVPLMRNGVVLGVISCGRAEARAFTKREIWLLKTFAAQAVIAIENARLFNETKEALERQTATAEVLKVISGSPTSIQPVFEAILDNATRLCEAPLGFLSLYDGEAFRTVAHQGANPEFAEWVVARGRYVPAPGTAFDQLIARLQPVQYEDYRESPGYRMRSPMSVKLAELGGVRSYLAVPMVQEGRLIGAIAVYRTELRGFSQKQVELLSTFADQAVIAIENVRLFKELQERTEALTKSVNQLTALGEVGQTISSTLDLETVLKTIVSRAVQLTGLDAGAIYEYDTATEQFHLRAAENISEEMLEVLRSTPIRKGDGAVGGTAVAREPIQVPETQDESYKSQFRDLIIRTGRRALLAVPLMHEEQIVGALAVQRNTPGPFAPEVVDLLKTFATQSALAIQNAKLFREIQEKSAQLEVANRQLEVANKHKSDFLANISHELRTPLNAIIGFSEALIDRMFGDMNEKQLDYQKDILESGKHLLSLINDILDLSKIEAGHMELELSTFHLPTALSNAVTLIRERALRHGIALGVEVDPRLGDFQADERKVKQVLLNLLSNAVKFTPDGGRVEVTAKLDADNVEIAVKDTGVGISPDDQVSLFEEFKQLGKDSSRKAEGTGLGLALTKRLVELHGGEIRVESAVGRGSTFRVMLPSSVGVT